MSTYYVDDYIVVGYYERQVDSGSISLSSAFIQSADVDIADDTSYFIPDYIQEGYFELPVVEMEALTLSVNASVNAVATRVKSTTVELDLVATQTVVIGKLQNAEADFGALFTPNFVAVARKNSTAILHCVSDLDATVSPIRDNDATLNNIVNLSLQGAKFAGFESIQSSAFTYTTAPDRLRDYGAVFVSTASITANATSNKDVSVSLDSAFTQTAQGDRVRYIEAEADLSSAFTQNASAIKYQLKTKNFDRPLNFTSSNEIAYSFDEAYGTKSLTLQTTGSSFASTDETTSLAVPANEEWVVEFWIKIRSTPTISQKPVVVSYGNVAEDDFDALSGNETDMGWAVGFDENRRIYATVYDSNGTRQIIAPGSEDDQIPLLTWTHVILRRRFLGGTTYIYETLINENFVSSKSVSNGVQTPTSGNRTLNLINNYSTAGGNDDVQIDELHIQRGTDVHNGYDQQPLGYYDTTVGLWHFEDTLNDDTGVILDASATLNAEFTQTAIVGATFDSTTLVVSAGTITIDANVVASGDASLTAQSSISTQGGFLKDASTAFESIATQISVINKIGNTLVALDNNFSLSADVNEIAQLASDLASAFTQLSDVNLIAKGEAEFDAQADIAADVSGGFIGLTPMTLSAEFTQSTDNIRVRFADLDAQAGAFTQSVTAQKITDITSSPQGVFTQTAEAKRIRDAEANFGALFTPSIDAVAKINSTAILHSVASLSIDANVTTGSVIDITSVATQTTDPVITADAVADFDSAFFILLANGTVNVTGQANLNSVATATIEPVKITELETEFNGIATIQTVEPSVTRGFNSQLNTNFDTTVNVERFRQGVSSLQSAFTKTVNAGKLVDVVIDLGALFTPSIDYRIIHVDQYVYTIPPEIRSYSISGESRSFTIHEETRTYSIIGD